MCKYCTCIVYSVHVYLDVFSSVYKCIHNNYYGALHNRCDHTEKVIKLAHHNNYNSVEYCMCSLINILMNHRKHFKQLLIQEYIICSVTGHVYDP